MALLDSNCRWAPRTGHYNASVLPRCEFLALILMGGKLKASLGRGFLFVFTLSTTNGASSNNHYYFHSVNCCESFVIHNNRDELVHFSPIDFRAVADNLAYLLQYKIDEYTTNQQLLWQV